LFIISCFHSLPVSAFFQHELSRCYQWWIKPEAEKVPLVILPSIKHLQASDMNLEGNLDGLSESAENPLRTLNRTKRAIYGWTLSNPLDLNQMFNILKFRIACDNGRVFFGSNQAAQID